LLWNTLYERKLPIQFSGRTRSCVRFELKLAHPAGGLSGGGEGECQLSDSSVMNVELTPS